MDRSEMAPMPPALVDTLALVATALRPAAQPWWIIGSAAVALHGAHDMVADIDVLLDIADARLILPTLGLAVAPGTASTMFRSAVFATWTSAAMPVEFMARFERRTPTGWHEVRPASRMPVRVADGIVFVPDRAELHDLLHAFGRPKDLHRARLIAALD